ncbi:hypothetical protein LUW77_00965 [Streptomyces radiopugnans]|nr:hypothetical protein LUW77_00965 [Streptomyces radiopugnans]
MFPDADGEPWQRVVPVEEATVAIEVSDVPEAGLLSRAGRRGLRRLRPRRRPAGARLAVPPHRRRARAVRGGPPHMPATAGPRRPSSATSARPTAPA